MRPKWWYSVCGGLVTRGSSFLRWAVVWDALKGESLVGLAACDEVKLEIWDHQKANSLHS